MPQERVVKEWEKKSLGAVWKINSQPIVGLLSNSLWSLRRLSGYYLSFIHIMPLLVFTFFIGLLLEIAGCCVNKKETCMLMEKVEETIGSKGVIHWHSVTYIYKKLRTLLSLFFIKDGGKWENG